METKETASSTEKALIWWNSLPVWGIPSKEYYMGLYYSDDDVTPERIEEVWKKETFYTLEETKENIKNFKSNQKQYSQEEVDRLLDQQAAITTAQILRSNQKEFKQFDESLFRAYLNKFSEEDKFKAFISNLNELSKEIQFNAFLAILKKMNLDSQIQSNIMTLVALKDI